MLKAREQYQKNLKAGRAHAQSNPGEHFFPTVNEGTGKKPWKLSPSLLACVLCGQRPPAEGEDAGTCPGDLSE